jgi:hypothetical protein
MGTKPAMDSTIDTATRHTILSLLKRIADNQSSMEDATCLKSLAPIIQQIIGMKADAAAQPAQAPLDIGDLLVDPVTATSSSNADKRNSVAVQLDARD